MKLKYQIVLVTLLCVIIYLLFSFNQVTLDISKWTEGSRDGCASLTGLLITLATIVSLVDFSDKKK